MESIHVELQHWKHIFPNETLIRYGSPHYSSQDARKVLNSQIFSSANKESEHALDFDRDQIICGNEAFPEAAAADPLADLEVWDEWQSGVRAFPYTGKYSRLGITTQTGKISNPSSVGVIGEIIAGIFAQSFISPWVLVRVNRRWPDFIFYENKHDRYSFVESKAFTNMRGDNLKSRVPNSLLGDCLIDAVRQLNADAMVKVWYSFTSIITVDPMTFQVTLLELDIPETRLKTLTLKMMPEPVVSSLVVRAIEKAALTFPESVLEESFHPTAKNWRQREDAEYKLAKAAEDEIEELLIGAGPEAALSTARQQIQSEIQVRIPKLRIFEGEGEGKRLRAAKMRGAEGVLRRVRPLADSFLYIADLPEEARQKADRNWSPSIPSALMPWKEIDGIKLWRCGGAVFCTSRSNLDGKSIADDVLIPH